MKQSKIWCFSISVALFLIVSFPLIADELDISNETVTDNSERAPRPDKPGVNSPSSPLSPTDNGEFGCLTVRGDAKIGGCLRVCGKIKNKEFEALESCCEEARSRLDLVESCCDDHETRIEEQESCFLID